MSFQSLFCKSIEGVVEINGVAPNFPKTTNPVITAGALTAAQLFGGIIGNQTNSPISFDLPTGTAMTNLFKPTTVGDYFDVAVFISGGGGTVTINNNTDFVVVGNVFTVTPYSLLCVWQGGVTWRAFIH